MGSEDGADQDRGIEPNQKPAPRKASPIAQLWNDERHEPEELSPIRDQVVEEGAESRTAQVTNHRDVHGNVGRTPLLLVS
jgi:hypothetical protein